MDNPYVDNILGYMSQLNRRIKRNKLCYLLEVSNAVAYYAKIMSGKIHFRLWTGSAPGVRDFCIWKIDFDDENAIALESRLHEIIEDKTSWLQRLLGLENELAIDALPGK